MTPTDVLLAGLRKAGIVLRTSGERLVVEAPAGLVSPQLRDELAHRKEELLFALQDSIELQVHSLDKEPIRDIAKLLATAYRRYLNRPAGSVAGLESPANGVAFYGGSSAHEDGTQDAD